MKHKTYIFLIISTLILLTLCTYSYLGAQIQNRLGIVVGRIEISPGVPAPGFKVLVEGVPLGETCDSEGNFVIPAVPVGSNYLRILDLNGPKVVKRIVVGVNHNSTTTLGAIVVGQNDVGQLGVVHGRITGAKPEYLAGMVVHILDCGIATKPDSYGYYVLDRIPKGDRQIILTGIWWEHPRAKRGKKVSVKGGDMIQGIDFILKPPKVEHSQIKPQDAIHKEPKNLKNDGLLKKSGKEIIKKLSPDLPNLPTSKKFSGEAIRGARVVSVEGRDIILEVDYQLASSRSAPVYVSGFLNDTEGQRFGKNVPKLVPVTSRGKVKIAIWVSGDSRASAKEIVIFFHMKDQVQRFLVKRFPFKHHFR